LLDFSKKIELRILSALVKQVSAAVRTPYLLAGATARDLLLVYAHEIPNNRATVDVDLAFLMESWGEFETLRKKLLAGGDFVEVPRKGIHKLRFRRTLEVDILPFGGVERRDRSIVLPPDNAFEMSMFGFKEALGSAVTVKLPDDARVQVVSLPALAILKFSAWTERRHREPGKDAYDLLLIIKNYASASGERLYDANPHVPGSPSDYEAAGAWLLGKDMAQLLDETGRERLARIIADEADEAGQLRLVGDMTRHDPERVLELLGALEDGFIGGRDDQ
jgi:predicted nucleotidyltransferase